MTLTAISKLRENLGDRVKTDWESRYSQSFDGSKLSFIPDAVITPDQAEQIGVVLNLANAYQIPVTTRGAGSSLTGSACPLRRGWVLDMHLLNDIKINRLEKWAEVGAGAILSDIQKQAQSVNLFYPVDPSSAKFCTIGGTIACNAGGLRCVKYGVTRDYIMALEGYLPTGEAVKWSRPLRKFSAGYNIRDLWIGSEGTLGVITRAIIRLIEKPPSVWMGIFAFPDEKTALQAAQSLIQSGIVPSMLEFLDRLTIHGAEKLNHKSFFPNISGTSNPQKYALLMVELDGRPEIVEQDRSSILEWSKSAIAFRESQQAFNQAENTLESLWEVRRSCSSAMFQHGDTKLNEDVVVPIECLPSLIDFISDRSQKSGLAIPTFGHVGDGNLHVNIMYNRNDKAMVQKAVDALSDLMEKVIALGGAISGEHGIGLAKTAFFRLQHSEYEVKIMQKIKDVFDPHHILNPGKIFEIFKPWEHEPVTIKLPWDHK